MKSLKTTMLVLVFAALAIGAQAQQKSPFNTEKAIQQKTNRMATELGLNATQKQQLLELNKAEQEKHKNRMAEIKKNTPKNSNGVSKSAAAKARNDAKKDNQAYDQAVRKLLTAEQVKKYDDKFGPGKQPVRK